MVQVSYVLSEPPGTVGNAVLTVLKSNEFPPEDCINSIQDYTAARILGNIYQFYCQLSGNQ